MDDIAAADQRQAHMRRLCLAARQIADTAYVLFTAFCDAGFTRSEANRLTQVWIGNVTRK